MVNIYLGTRAAQIGDNLDGILFRGGVPVLRPVNMKGLSNYGLDMDSLDNDLSIFKERDHEIVSHKDFA